MILVSNVWAIGQSVAHERRKVRCHCTEEILVAVNDVCKQMFSIHGIPLYRFNESKQDCVPDEHR